MKETELKAAIYLLTDPDTEVSHQIEKHLIDIGPEIIPQLEQNWEQSFDETIQEKLENIIQKIQFEQIKHELQIWLLHNTEDLIEGLTIINRYQFPNLDDSYITYQLAELRRSAWLELMYDVSAVDKVKLLNRIIFREYGLSGNTSNYHDPNNSFISKVLESKKGNPISLSCIYSIIAQKLDIPIYGVNLPKHFIVAYMDGENKDPLFYINPFNKGMIMKPEDIYGFLRQQNLPATPEYTHPCDNVAIIKRTLRNLTTAFSSESEKRKREEIEILLKLVENN